MEADPCIKPLFQGIYSIDQLPTYVENRPSLCIINSDLAQNVGQHWICAYFADDQDKSCDFWDSLGQPPSVYGEYMTSFLDRNCSRYFYNDVCLQGDWSSVCGHYVIYFAYYRSRHVPLYCIKNHFGLCTNVNDLYVYRFCMKHFPCILF